MCAFNGGIQLIWGAILAVSLQERCIALAGHNGVRAYAFAAASGAVVATLVQVGAGVLSDRRRARTGNRLVFYAAGVALAIPALGWFYLARSIAGLAAAFLVLQLAMNVAGGPYQAVIPDYVPLERRGRTSAWMSAYQSLGNAAGLVVAGFVHDLRVVAATLAAGLASACAVTMFYARTLPRDARTTFVPVAAFDIRGPLGALLISRGLINVGFFTLLGFLLFFVRDSLGVRGQSVTTQTALLFLTFTLAAVPGAALAGRPADRFDKRVVVSAAVAAIVVALMALATATSPTIAYPAAALAGAAWGAFVTADWALATALLPPGAMGTAMGVWNVATTLPQVFAPLVAAPLVLRFDAIGRGLGPRAAIVLATIEFAAGAVAIWRLPRS